MKRKLFLSFAAVFLFTSSGSHAAVFERDLVPSSGDGLLTFDDVNNREWLDLSESLLEQFPGADPGATLEVDLETRYQNVVAELGPGGMFAGFTVGKSADVIALAQSAGIDTGTIDFPTNGMASENLINLLGVTITRQFGQISSFGYLDEPSVPVRPPPSRLAMLLDFDPPEITGNIGNAGVRFGSTDPIAKSTIGVMLYRQIPEPSSVVLTVWCLAGASFICRRKSVNFHR